MHTSWTKGQLIFRKEHLPKMAHRLERWYNVKIELDNDTRLEDIHYTATIEMESFSEVLNLLKVTAPVDYTWDEKTRVIKLFYQKNNQQQ
jgi:ferric-dicitrate binding protein FerR (iron transport regulator)